MGNSKERYHPEMLHVYLRRSPSPTPGMTTSASTSGIRTNPNVQPMPSSYSASNLAVGSTTGVGQLSPFSLGEPLGEPRHQYRPQRPTRLNVPDSTYCLSCLPSGLNFSAAMVAKQQLPVQSRGEVSLSEGPSIYLIKIYQGNIVTVSY